MISRLFAHRTWYRVCSVDELAPGTGGVFTVAGRPILLLRTEEGYHALHNICPHAGSPIGAATFDGETVTCRTHMMRFDVRTGICPDAPSWAAESYPVRVQDDSIEVAL